MAIYERDGYGTICYKAEYYARVIGSAKRMHSHCMDRAKYYRTHNYRPHFVNMELLMAATYRQMIVNNMRDMEYAKAREYRAWELNMSHDI